MTCRPVYVTLYLDNSTGGFMVYKNPVVISVDGDKHETLGEGSTLAPGSIPISAEPDNGLVVKDDGLYAATSGGELTSVSHDDSLSGAGTTSSPLSVQLSADSGNLLSVKDDGLYAATSGGELTSVSHDDSLSGAGTTSSPLSVQLSADSGNLLESRVGGLYYGIAAPDDVSNLYIDDVLGSDDNPGTKEAPLKTLAAAFSKVKSCQDNTMWLKAGGNFIWPDGEVSGGASRILRVYDDPYVDGEKVPGLTEGKPVYLDWLRGSLNRPTITLDFVYSEETKSFWNRAVNVHGGAGIQFYGIHLVASGLNQPGTGGMPGGFDKTWSNLQPSGFLYGDASAMCSFYGCQISMSHAPGIVMPASEDWRYIVEAPENGQGLPAVTLNGCCLNNISSGTVISPVVALNGAVGWVQILDSKDSFGGDSGYEYLTQNIPSILDGTSELVGGYYSDVVIGGIVRYSDGRPANVLSNQLLDKNSDD